MGYWFIGVCILVGVWFGYCLVEKVGRGVINQLRQCVGELNDIRFELTKKRVLAERKEERENEFALRVKKEV